MRPGLLFKLLSFVFISIGFVVIVIYYSNALPKDPSYRSDDYKFSMFNIGFGHRHTGNGDTTEKSFSVNPNGTLYIKSDFAKIKIETWDKNEVNVVIDKDGDSEKLKNYKISFSNTPDKVEIYGEQEGSFWNWGNMSITFTIKIPKNFNNDIHNTAGDIRINDASGNVKIRTSAGNIVLNDIKGEVDIEASAGNIEMKSISGMVKASTSAGNIKLYLAEENQGVNMETSAGNIHVYVSESTKANLHCSAGLGNVNLSIKEGFSGDIDHNDVDGTLNGGGKEIKLHTSIGNVSLSSLK